MIRDLAALGVVCALSAGPAIAKPPEAATDYEAIFATVERMERSGASQAAIDRMLEREFGWIRETEDAVIEALAAPSASDITLSKPTLYRSIPAQRYEVTAKWQWKQCVYYRCWAENYPLDTGNIGGPDGFAINVSRNVTNLATNFVTYDEYGNSRLFTNPEVFEGDGVGFAEQDTQVTTRLRYSWDHGTLVYAFRLAGACVPGQQFKFSSKMGHTWSTAALSSISISTTGISMTYSGAEGKWTAVNPYPLYWTPC
jgi:hypothetical protein